MIQTSEEARSQKRSNQEKEEIKEIRKRASGRERKQGMGELDIVRSAEPDELLPIELKFRSHSSLVPSMSTRLV